MRAKYTILKPLDKKSITRFMDFTVHEAASTTLNMTTGHFPVRTGDLMRGSYAFGVKGANATYGLGTTVNYGVYVWNMEGVNWTNPSTLPKWYKTVFDNNKETIMFQAVTKAIESVGGQRL